jgi:hypothetical protein
LNNLIWQVSHLFLYEATGLVGKTKCSFSVHLLEVVQWKRRTSMVLKQWALVRPAFDFLPCHIIWGQ